MNEILSKLKEVDSPDQYAYILYTYANSRLRPSNYVTKKFDKIAYDQEETKKVVNTIFEPLFSNIPAMSLDALSLLSKSFFILQLEGYQDIMIRIERGALTTKGFQPLGACLFGFRAPKSCFALVEIFLPLFCRLRAR